MTAVEIGGPYITLAQLKAYLGLSDSNTAQDASLSSRIASASSDINRWTGRQFGRAEVASERTFRVGRSGVDVHDFWSTEDLAVIPYLGQTAGSAWDVSALVLEPLDGIVDQVPGWPYNRICTGYGDHPLNMAFFYSASTVRVTAKWGWEDVPENVITACLMLASSDAKAKDAPFGVAGFGDYAIRVRSNPMVEEKLRPYMIQSIKVAS